MRAKFNSNQANQNASSPQPSITISVIDTGQPTSQVSTAVLESDSHISPGVSGVFAMYLHATVETILTLLLHHVLKM